jgi:hypothetical protein
MWMSARSTTWLPNSATFFGTAVPANFLELSLDDVAQRNVDKLADRQRRSVLGALPTTPENCPDLPR